ncbi:MAG: hypothetical protein ACFB00_01500, partial [Parvularculaceae bacterium]
AVDAVMVRLPSVREKVRERWPPHLAPTSKNWVPGRSMKEHFARPCVAARREKVTGGRSVSE